MLIRIIALNEIAFTSNESQLSIEELKEELNLRFERRSTKQSADSGEENALFTLQCKGKCRNYAKVGHKAEQCKSKHGKHEKKDVVCRHCKKPDHVKANYFKLMKKNIKGFFVLGVKMKPLLNDASTAVIESKKRKLKI